MPSDFIHNPGNGSLWKNDYKTEEKHPDMRGKMTSEEGVEKQVAAWWKESGNGDKYLSIKVEDVFVKKEKTEGPNDPGDEQKKDSEDDDLPF